MHTLSSFHGLISWYLSIVNHYSRTNLSILISWLNLLVSVELIFMFFYTST